jgi:hypothetical protein
VSGGRRVWGRRTWVAIIACLLGACLVWVEGGELAQAAQTQVAANAPAPRVAPASHQAPVSRGHSAGPPKSPNEPPLGTGTGTGKATSAEEEASASAAPSGGDPLAGNGLDSPLCGDVGDELSGAAMRDCRSSGFEGARAPTGNYGLDVHIDTGVTHLGNEVAVLFENLMQLWWAILVAVVRGVIVILDWCFTIDLLNSRSMSKVAQGLHEAQVTFTKPWLALVLVIASVIALYHGLIRRRVAQTLGEALLMMTMMAGGLWVIMNPMGTIGVLGGWVNEASLGTLAVAANGSPERSNHTLAEDNRTLFGTAIDGPWCFMEFGSVSWCEAPAEPHLQAVTRKLAALAKVSGEGGPPHKVLEWVITGNEEGEAPYVSRQSAALLAGEHTNGELFLALPANGSARNSINSEWSLFRVLCGSNKEPCRGPTASEAEFRTQSGTWSRAIGLTLITFGLLGMLLLLGFIGWRLLFAAFMSLIYLLLTPAAVLLPALGESGRSAFRTWVIRLLGAVATKLIYSFLLGAVLMAQRVLSGAHLFGWFIQWLMLSSLWWIVYLRRHHLFDLSLGMAGSGEQRSVLRRMNGALESRKGVATARWTKRKLSQPGPSVERRKRLAQAGRERAEQIANAQVAGGLEHRHREASELVEQGNAAQGRISAERTRLGKMQAQRAAWLTKGAEASRAGEMAQGEYGELLALSSRKAAERREEKAALAKLPDDERKKGEREVEKERKARMLRLKYLRRAVPRHRAEVRSYNQSAAALQPRMNGLRAEIDRDQAALTGAKQLVKDGEQAEQATGKLHTRAQTEEFGRYLDEQARLPRSQRDHAGMAGVVGMAPGEYKQLGPREQLRARLGIHREIAKRVALDGAVADMTAKASASAVGWRDKRKASSELESRVPPVRARSRGSTVLDDARQVQARRKRQLGRDRL